ARSASATASEASSVPSCDACAMASVRSAPERLAQPRAALLLVDDDPLIAEALSFALGVHYAVHSCASRAAALDLVRSLAAPPGSDVALVGESPALAKLKNQIAQFAPAPYPVLIEGESGSGKEMAARSLHRLSPRAQRPYLTLNCAAIAPTLVEPTLFGYVKGAFTGAASNKSGYFEDAADGTLLLDEIGELPLELQAKLLRVLETGEYQ